MSIKIYDTASQQYKKCKIKIYKNGSWIEAPIKYNNAVIQDNNFIPNLSDYKNEWENNWGYKCLDDEGDSDKLKELYARIWNAYTYLDNYEKVYYNKYGTDDLILYSKPYTTETISGDNCLNVYLEDLSVTINQAILVHKLFEFDSYSLIPKWCFSNKTNYVPVIFSSSGIGFFNIQLPYYNNETIKTYKSYLESSFKSINEKIKECYDIDFKERGYYKNNKFYTKKQKLQIAKVIHDWLVYHNIYGSETTPEEGNQEIWPAMSNGVYKPVCIGYAKAFCYCCRRWGITALLCYGYAGGNHAWATYTCEPLTINDLNFDLSSNWMDVDVTWDDTSSGNNYIRWKYFNKTTEFFENNSHVRTFIDGGYKNEDGEEVVNGRIKKMPCISEDSSHTYIDNVITSGESSDKYSYVGFENIEE